MVLSVSRLSKSKNIYKVIEVAGFLDESYVWIVLGNGNEYKNLKAEITRRKLDGKVLLLGEKNHTAEYYSRCDVFVHLSYYENFGQVLMEAMAYGKPPVVLDSNLPGVSTASSELIEDGYNGFFVSNDPQEIAAKITEVSKHNQNISDNCIRFVKDKYTFEKHLKGLYELMDTICPS